MRRFFLGFSAFLLFSAGALAYAIESNPDVGPFLADTARAWVGPEWVAQGEEVFYGLRDALTQQLHKDDAPEVLWVPRPSPWRPPLERLLVPEDTGEAPVMDVDSHFPPPDFRPPVPKVAAAADGLWSAFPEPMVHTSAQPLLVRAMVHPDADRPYASVAVVAMDLDRLRLRMVAGTVHPSSADFPASHRHGKVSDGDLPWLVAIFNGGWQSIHGHLGMMVDHEVILPINPWGCTILLYEDDRVAIMSGPRAAQEQGVRSFRQAVPCLVEQGVPHKSLEDEHSINWGYALGGGSIVTRSALGIDAEGRTLFYAYGNEQSGKSITSALVAAGAVTVAMLDINTWFPRFYAIDPESPWDAPSLLPLVPKIRDPKGTYIDIASARDFMYVMRRE